MTLKRRLKYFNLVGRGPPNSLCLKRYDHLKLTQVKCHSETQSERKLPTQLYIKGF